MARRTARPVLSDVGLWRRQPLTIPPDSWRAWISLAAWECWMGALIAAALGSGTQLIVIAPRSIVTIMVPICLSASPQRPCERIPYRTGELSAAMNAWCGLLLIAFAAWLLWELWSAAAPKPISDEFLQLLDESFARDWRNPRTWPWARVGWAYGFTLLGATSAIGIGLLVVNLWSSPRPASAPRAFLSWTSASTRG